MKLNEAQALAEQAIYDYTSSTKWQEVKYMKWTTAEMQDVIAKALVKNIEVIHCCATLKIKELMTFEDYRNNLFIKSDGVYQPKKSKLFRWYSEKQLKKMYNNEPL